jgi:uncharacterized short protein YbdD (DUF466 family)
MLGRGNGGTREGWNAGTFLRSHVPSFLRRLAGMPDYAAHLEHLRQCHPGQPIPTERQFYEEFLRTRYADGPTRCC